MKKLILSLLVFAMMLPGLACAEILHHAPAKQSCHGMKQAPASSPSGVMLFKDCAKSDLQKTSSVPVLKKPVFEKDYFSVPIVLGSLVSSDGHPSSFHATGPPFVRLTSDITHPPILLTSPRLRI